jgi:hypothetical protein
MEAFGGLLVGAVLLVVLLYAVPRLVGGGNYVVCTRCEGTGQIDERWPDPSEPSGFHVATGKCPKCKGKGKVKT